MLHTGEFWPLFRAFLPDGPPQATLIGMQFIVGNLVGIERTACDGEG
jgi:hypothetical protein